MNNQNTVFSHYGYGSLMVWLEEGVNIEIMMVDDEGIFGASALIDSNNFSFMETIAKKSGYGCQFSIKIFEKIFFHSKERRSEILKD